MSREFWAIIGTGISLGVLVVALAAFMVTSANAINSKLDSMDARLLRIESVLEGVISRLGRVEGRLQIPDDPDLEETQARPRASPDAGA